MIRAFALAAVVAATELPQSAPVPIDGAFVHSNAMVDAAAWARLPKAVTTAADHDGTSHEYAGVRLADVLRDAGSPMGQAVRGPAARAYLLVSASDGYSAVFSLGELETTQTRCAPLLVDQQDGAPLPADVGPERVVAACDRTHARWVRNVTKLTLVLAAGSHS